MAFLPLKNFALSLSGGGFRAAAFHLGSLSFLHALTFKFSDEEDTASDVFLDRLKILSTISGGTITGMIFAEGYLEEKGFAHSFKKLYTLLEADKLVDTALEKLNRADKWADPNRTRNLINAFADVYNQEFFENKTFRLFQEKQDKDLVFVFNATEFSSGLAFRFQNTGFFGNANFRIPDKGAACIRLGDIVAASSCFPMGFEPMEFPHDFCDAGPNALLDYWTEKHKNPLAVMDGGIIDNQGIEGIDLATERLKKGGTDIQGFIISSVEGRDLEPFVPSAKIGNTLWQKLTLKKVKAIGLGTAIVFLLTAFFIYLYKNDSITLTWLGLVVGLATGGTLIGILTLLLYYLQDKFESTVQTVVDSEDQTISSSLKGLDKAPLGVLWNLIGARAFSFLSMVNGVFLRRIRRIQFKEVFQGERWKNKAVGNFIYSLLEEKPQNLDKKWDSILTLANEMPTTLWFKKDHEDNQMLDALIMTGQLTVCCKLIDYLEDLQGRSAYEEVPDVHKKDLHRLSASLIQWREDLIKEPELLLKRYLSA